MMQISKVILPGPFERHKVMFWTKKITEKWLFQKAFSANLIVRRSNGSGSLNLARFDEVKTSIHSEFRLVYKKNGQFLLL